MFLLPCVAHPRRQAECAKTARIQMALPAGKPASAAANNLYEELGDSTMRGYAQQEQQQLLRPSLLRPEELSMESGIDPGQEYYGQDYYSYDHGYELPQYGSRRRLLSPSGMYDEYGEVVVEHDGGYYYSPHGSTAEEGMVEGRGPPSRGISQRAGAQIEGRPLGGGMDLRHGSGRAYRTSQGKRRLKAVMHLSRVAVSARKPIGRAESARSPWKKAKIFPMILQRVKGGRKDSSYAKLMSARQVDDEKSMVIRGSYFQKSTDDRPSMRKLNHVLKRISVARKFQEPTSKDSAHARRKGEEDDERDEAKSGVSISITAESEHEDSDYEKKKKKRRKYTSDESSVKSSSSGSDSEDKDYLKVTLDQDEATESTVDSDEETGHDFGDSDDDSGSSSSSESEEDSSEEDDDEEDSDSDEDGSLSKSSSTQSSCSKSGTSESSSRRSTERSSVKGRGDSSRGKARRSSQKSNISSSASGSDRDTSYRRTSGSSYKSKTSSASVEIEDTIEEVSEEDEQVDVEQVSASPDETADNSNKTVSETSANAKTAATEESKRGKSAVNGEDSVEECTEEGDTDASDREETISKNESSCLESETSVTSKGTEGTKSTTSATSGKTATSPDTENQSSDTKMKRKEWARKKRIKLIVDPEYETSSTGEDSAPDSSQRNRLNNPNVHNSINGNIYIAQNGSVVRTRRVCLGNNLKVTSPVRLGKQFKKLDKLAVTHEENVPLNTMSKGPSSSDKMNTRPCSVSFASSTIGAENVVTKPRGSKMKSTEEQESVVDNEDVKEPLESHSEHTQSDEEELWMGPWNNLHIPMTKL
ncbi:PREDICTED: flocculation protein FLO11-like [Mesitornis unicolor]|uniref:flocculation protein FLO11-like n=1 Tax=Mesitornis unicolor TaxID=54374 RepID=UPI000528AA82|nr:PREDICTED: flocculation protein FLO11-like [Mesitornis unicolor]